MQGIEWPEEVQILLSGPAGAGVTTLYDGKAWTNLDEVSTPGTLSVFTPAGYYHDEG